MKLSGRSAVRCSARTGVLKYKYWRYLKCLLENNHWLLTGTTLIICTCFSSNTCKCKILETCPKSFCNNKGVSKIWVILDMTFSRNSCLGFKYLKLQHQQWNNLNISYSVFDSNSHKHRQEDNTYLTRNYTEYITSELCNFYHEKR